MVQRLPGLYRTTFGVLDATVASGYAACPEHALDDACRCLRLGEGAEAGQAGVLLLGAQVEAQVRQEDLMPRLAETDLGPRQRQGRGGTRRRVELTDEDDLDRLVPRARPPAAAGVTMARQRASQRASLARRRSARHSSSVSRPSRSSGTCSRSDVSSRPGRMGAASQSGSSANGPRASMAGSCVVVLMGASRGSGRWCPAG